MQSPGSVDNHKFPVIKSSLLSASIPPQVGIEGGTPKPRKERLDSAIIELPTLKEAITISGAIELGRIFRNIMEK